MIEETGLVVASEAGLAQVEIIKTSSCNSCHANGACGTAAVSRFFNFRAPVVEVKNAINAQPGDRVVVAIADDTILKGSFLLYLAPLLSMLLFALTADYLAGSVGIVDSEPYNIVAGLFGLALGLVAVNRLATTFLGRSSGKAHITRIVSAAALQVSLSEPG